MRSAAPALVLALLTLHATAQQTPTAEAVMARVASNQDSSEASRLRFVYLQHARVTSRKGKTLRCEEITDSRVTPLEHGSQQQLLTLQGKVLSKGHYITYDRPADAKSEAKSDDDSLRIQISSGEADRDIVEHMRANFTNDSGQSSRDGIASGLFPLTSKNQAHYIFTLLGREPRNGRDTWHIAFRPKENDDFDWKGDAWIDTTAFEPVVIRTSLSRGVPFAVRAFLGTNVPGLGFTVIYAPQPGDQPAGVWFPTTFGTEFKMRIFFLFSRQIIINAENRDFAQTHVTSRILDNPASPSSPPGPGPPSPP